MQFFSEITWKNVSILHHRLDTLHYAKGMEWQLEKLCENANIYIPYEAEQSLAV